MARSMTGDGILRCSLSVFGFLMAQAGFLMAQAGFLMAGPGS